MTKHIMNKKTCKYFRRIARAAAFER